MSFVIAAPSSGSGKTTITLGLLRAFADKGMPHRGAKSGPDYIDPRFHALASRRSCMNLDAWAMTPDRIASLAAGDPLIIEGAMGLFDGAPPCAKGATADLARQLELPVVLVIDAAKQAQSVAALVHGFSTFDPTIQIAGVILNNVGSARHEHMLRSAIAKTKHQVFGALRRDTCLQLPSRHLGLVQAQEHPDITTYLTRASEIIQNSLDLSALATLGPGSLPATTHLGIAAPGQSIAVAQDAAFAFHYPHLIRDWQAAGATVRFFSPLANDPVPAADFVYLPGGYPELFAAQIAANTTFLDSLRNASQHIDIYGECGGYMTLGGTLVDADGQNHHMAGLLPLTTSFAQRKRHLGYRTLSATHGPFKGQWTAHEFHYATTLRAQGTPLFCATDAAGNNLPDMGLIRGRVSGSFAHIIDKATSPIAPPKADSYR